MKGRRRVPLAFTGSAPGLRQATRRARIVNLVLTGLATSIVRRQAADYLLRHTTVDGSAIERVPVRASRWPAILLVLAFVAARVAGEFGVGPPLPVVIVAGVLLLPYLWASVAMRTMAGWRWRGLQASLSVPWREVYIESWPLLALGFAWALLQPMVARAGTVEPSWVALAVLVALPLLALLAFNWRRLRFTRTRLGTLDVQWNARLRDYLQAWLVTALALLATAVAPVLLLRHALFGAIALQGPGALQGWIVYGLALLLVVLLAAPARAWYEAKVFALSWDGLRIGDAACVACDLDPRAFVVLRTRDAWRTALTFGRSGPDGAVRAHAAKLASLRVLEAPPAL